MASCHYRLSCLVVAGLLPAAQDCSRSRDIEFPSLVQGGREDVESVRGGEPLASAAFTGPCLVTSQLRQSSLRPFPLAVMPGARVTVGCGGWS